MASSSASSNPNRFQTDLTTKPQRSNAANFVVISLGILILLSGVGLLFYALVTTRGRDAIINAKVITLQAPDDGIVTDFQIRPGEEVPVNQPLLRIENARASTFDQARLQTQLNTEQQKLKLKQDQLAAIVQLRQQVELDSRNQQHLEITKFTELRRKLQADISAAREQLALAQRIYQRRQALAATGAVSVEVADQAETEYLRQRDILNALTKELASREQDLQAARLGLTLVNTRSNYDPGVRLQELKLQESQLRSQVAAQTAQVNGLKNQLQEITRNTRSRQEIPLASPVPTVLWQASVSNGDVVTRGQILAKTIDCRDRWVDVYIGETALRKIRVGEPARVDLIGKDRSLEGKVIFIRSGVGRLRVGEDVLPSIPINLARESQVRIQLNPDKIQPSEFCDVGFTGRVTFQNL
ncbi:HlyD family secretion protein [Synechococcus elongatus]|uniref:HlyD family efflux transporter periplasmic adaptor subunit n=1 Tax=Synechococcus elongatus PCC 11802 TaxID=2283154 RepID=A0AAT9JVF7_SYNEL|nr:HlyD family efflux transporter periplasmic adaptor subunit [Synechococcus elongatus PCC 11802]